MPSKAEINTTEPEESPIDPIDELLVTYLDGELDEVSRTELEERLVGDDPLRRRLGELQSGWEMLDALPVANVTEDFARTTVEMVAASESQILQAQRKQIPRKFLGWAAALVLATGLCGVIGYAIPGWLHQRQFDAELHDLWLAESLDAFQVDVDLDLVERLAREPVWQDAMRLANDAGGINIAPPLDLAQRDDQQRIATISSSSRDIRVLMSANWTRLQDLNQQQLDAVRERAEAVSRTQSPTLTLQTLRQYSVWWQQLSPAAQNRIFQAKSEQRFEVILGEVQNSSGRWVRNYGSTLPETDRIPIEQQLLMIAKERLGQSREMLSGDNVGGERLSRMQRWLSSELEPTHVLAGMAMRNYTSDPRREEDDERLDRRIMATLFGPPSNPELTAIEELLSKQALAILNVQSDSDRQRSETLWNWCMEIAWQMSATQNSPASILNRYQALDDEYRENLDYQPPQQIFDQLKGQRGWRPRR